jgi:hypothetical protein
MEGSGVSDSCVCCLLAFSHNCCSISTAVVIMQRHIWFSSLADCMPGARLQWSCQCVLQLSDTAGELQLPATSFDWLLTVVQQGSRLDGWSM